MTASTAALWDGQADDFDEAPDHGLRHPAVRAAWLELLTSVLPPAPARVADLGCGTGTLSVLLAEQGHLVHGVDLSPRMVELAEHKAGSVEPRPRFEIGDAADPALATGSFDVALSRHVLWALPDPIAALGCWADLLVPGGRLVLVEGRWGTGVGLRADQVEALVAPHAATVEVRPLTDPGLWGREITDERFLVVAGT